MIDPKELMLNNVVLAPKMFLGNCQTDECNEMVFYRVVFVSSVFSNRFEPVELTPEILEAAGFDNGIKVIQTSFLATEFYVDLMDGDAGFNKHGLWFPCKHLHQLQNLYWCLCGQELQIDLTKLNKEK